MKRKLLLISVLAVLFSLTGCSSDDKKASDYDEEILIQMSEDIILEYNDVSDGAYNYYSAEGDKLQQSAVDGFRQAEITDGIGDFLNFDLSDGKTVFEEQSDGTILVTLYCDYTDRDVEVTIQYEPNLEYDMIRDEYVSIIQMWIEGYAMSMDDILASINSEYGVSLTNEDELLTFMMTADGYTPYNALECEVSAVYTTKELLIQAAQNTGIGMGTVFVLLIIISFIIYLLKFVPMLIGGAEKKTEKDEREAEPQVVANKAPAAAPKPAPAAAPKPAPAAKAENPENDAELVAVITAAIYAYESQNGTGAVSKDRLVVRSIRRAGRR